MRESVLLPIYLFGTVILTGFAVTIVVLLVVQKQRQVKARLERQRLQHEHETNLLRMTIEVQEQTLQTLAGEIHDGIGQVLSVSQLQLAGLRHHLSTEAGRSVLKEGLNNLRQSISDLRALSHSLHTDFVSRQNLDESIAAELERFRTASGLVIRLDVSGDLPELPSTVSLPIFRIFQEALQNIVKHAAARSVTVALRTAPEGLYLSVTDDGRGLPQIGKEQAPSLGISNMKRRASVLKGTLNVQPAPAGGTVVSLFVPVLSSRHA